MGQSNITSKINGKQRRRKTYSWNKAKMVERLYNVLKQFSKKNSKYVHILIHVSMTHKRFFS